MCHAWVQLTRECKLQRSEALILGDTAARIVAETFIGVLNGDALSYRSMYPNWKPTLPSEIHSMFTIADILNLAGV